MIRQLSNSHKTRPKNKSCLENKTKQSSTNKVTFVSIVFALLLMGCQANKTVKTGDVKKLVYETHILVPGFDKKMEELTQSLGEEFNNPNFQQEFESALSNEEHIEVDGKYIWYYLVTQGQEFNYARFDRNNCDSWLFPERKSKDSLPNPTLEMEYKYKLTVDTSERKEILGFDCYKVIIDLYEHLRPGTNMKTDIQLYVTDELHIPGNPLINLTKDCLPFCPLEIKKHIIDAEGTIITRTTAKSIQYQ